MLFGRRRNASVNPKFRKTLLDMMEEAGVSGGAGLEKGKGNLVYYCAGKVRAWRGGAAACMRRQQQGARSRARTGAQPCPHWRTAHGPPHAPPCAQYPANALAHRPTLLKLVIQDKIKVQRRGGCVLRCMLAARSSAAAREVCALASGARQMAPLRAPAPHAGQQPA